MRNKRDYKKSKSNSKGITLVALVVSIIVLLILAGASITAIMGENGILSKAANAKFEKDREDAEFEIQTALASAYYDQFGTDYGRNLVKVYSISNLQKYVTGRIDSTAVRPATSEKIIWYSNPQNSKYTMVVDKVGNITTTIGYSLPETFFYGDKEGNIDDNIINWYVSDEFDINLFDGFEIQSLLDSSGNVIADDNIIDKGNGNYQINQTVLNNNGGKATIVGTLNDKTIKVNLYNGAPENIEKIANNIDEFNLAYVLLSDKVQIGDYIDLDISYDSSAFNDSYNIGSTNTLNGWRVIDKTNTNQVKITTAGIGIAYNPGSTYDEDIKIQNAHTMLEVFNDIKNLETDLAGDEITFKNGQPARQAFASNKFIDQTKPIPIMSVNDIKRIYQMLFPNCTTFYNGYSTGVTVNEYEEIPEGEALVYVEFDNDISTMEYQMFSNKLLTDNKLIEKWNSIHSSGDGAEWNDRWNNLIFNNQGYYLGGELFGVTQVNARQLWFIKSTGELDKASNIRLGIRPVITLSADVCYQAEEGKDGLSADKAYSIALKSDYDIFK